MRRIVSQNRLATAVALLVLFTGSGILLKPRVARAFTLISEIIYFDPVSLTPGQTLHVHVVNQLGMNPIGIFATLKPTTPGLGSAVSGPAVTLLPGDGADQSFTFVSLSPTPGTMRIPVVCTIAVVAIPPGPPLPSDFSARTASSVEIIDDVTGRPTEITTTHHIVLHTTGPCAFCN